ncbi:ATP-dependent RNA helicase [Rhodotorula paludigena]|uniref:ATP-dependent RNA helicase n=1 Tax=Rhodotorula paludigena TaxID=86838 RepID=UPI00316D9B01
MPLNPHAAARIRQKKRGLAPSSRRTASSQPDASPAASSAPRPAKRTRTVPTNQLQWKKLVLPAEIGFDDDGGLLELDELEGVDIAHEDGKVVFKVIEDDADQPPQKKRNKGKARATADDEAAFVPVGDVVNEGDNPTFDDDEELTFQDEALSFPDEAVQPTEDGAVAPDAEVQKPQKGKEKAKAKGKKRARDEEAVAAPQDDEKAPNEPVDPQIVAPGWAHIPLANPLYRALGELGFSEPTEIQSRTLELDAAASSQTAEDADTAALTAPRVERDIVGIAQTGSGKTLAYGLPILSHILSQPPPPPAPSSAASSSSSDADAAPTRLAALILCPTRELALQVRTSLSSLAIRTLPPLPPSPATAALAPEDPRGRARGRLVQVVALTGGMSVDKQKRQLERGADVVVATPGRLWDLISDSDDLVREIKGIKFLVIDEADRMIENGHFAELENIVRLTRRGSAQGESGFVDDFKSAVSSRSNVNLLDARRDMRSFVFSATMSKELQRNLKRKGPKRFVPQQETGTMSSLDDLLDLVDFRDQDPAVIDLSPEHGLVETLKECKVECLQNEKDIHLYHFLLRYPARTIVFLAAIDGIRRLHPLLSLLKVNVIPLHSGMQQRQRLKALDKFKSSPDAVLLATDVAARGLDIPSVSHVVHYQLPRAADTYVHRSGRTARAGTEGLALQLVAPEEKNVQRMLMASLGKTTDLPTLPADFSILDQLKKRVELAKQIDQARHRLTKQAHEDKWLRDAAEAMEIDLDDDDEGSDADPAQVSSRKQRAQSQARSRALRAELDQLLAKPLMLRGVSAKYLTTRGRVGLVDQLVGGTGHSKIFGVESSTALDDLAAAPQGKKVKSVKGVAEAGEQDAEKPKAKGKGGKKQ